MTAGQITTLAEAAGYGGASVLDANKATITITGDQIDLVYTQGAPDPLQAQKATINVNALTTALVKNSNISLNKGSVTFTFDNINLVAGDVLQATKGAIAVTPQTVNLVANLIPRVLATKGTVSINGSSVFLQGPVELEPFEPIRGEFTVTGISTLIKNSNIKPTKDTVDLFERNIFLGDSGTEKATVAVTGKPVILKNPIYVRKRKFFTEPQSLFLDRTDIPNFIVTIPDISAQTGSTVTFLAAKNYIDNTAGVTDVVWRLAADDSLIATALPNKVNYKYLFANVQVANTGGYYMEVTNADGTSRSNTFQLTVADPAVITVQPADQTVVAGALATFTVTATGTGTLTYQWYKNGILQAGETAATYDFTASDFEDGSSVYVIVSDDVSNVQSNSASLTVQTVPTIVTQPSNLTVVENGQPGIFTVVADGTTPLTYEWFRNTIAIPSSNSPTLNIGSAAIGDNGDQFYVTVDNVTGTTATSNTITLTVTPATRTITKQPKDEVVVVTTDATFSVEATGSGTISYEWFENGISTGVTTSTYTKSGTLSTDSGNTYYVVVTDGAGSTQSNTVTLTVVNGLPFTFVTEGFGNREITVDRGLTQQMNPRVLTATFGEGYEQRISDGIESIEEQFTVTIANQTRAVVQDIEAFFDSLAGATAFKFYLPNSLLPNGVEELVVKCVQYNVIVTTDRYYTITATFEKVRDIV